ncbi:MAG: molybdate ABC transporter substrate-binding protein [Rhodobacteraceae bacterium]|nr:MAG: molybdate ABC transporter substrate-binding protein [Paracoccaceae bacterium]
MTIKRRITRLFCALGVALAPQLSVAETALVAVATNFAEVMDVLKANFEAETDHQIIIVTGSTGKLYAQIVNGAPFDVFLAADQARPERLAADERTLNAPFTFATGQLALWSVDANRIGDDGLQALTEPYRRLAIANPQLAPYGVAAKEALSALGLLENLQDRIVMGENIGQAHALIASGNAELGIVALAYAISPRNVVAGSYWVIPPELYTPIHQDGVLTLHAKGNVAASDFIAYLQSDPAKTIIRAYGYEVE